MRCLSRPGRKESSVGIISQVRRVFKENRQELAAPVWNLSASRRTRLEEETAMEKLRLGVIGIGNMGSEHCRLILAGRTPEVELCCVADPRADRRAWAQAELPKTVRVYPDGEALIRARGCDAALIATPPGASGFGTRAACA